MFKKIDTNGTSWILREGVSPAILDNLLQKLHNSENYPELTLLKDNNVRSAFLLRESPHPASEVFIKRYKCRGWKDIVKHMVVPSKALSEWRALRKIEARKLPCPTPLAFTEKRSSGMLTDCCLIAESISSAIPLNEYVHTIHGQVRKKTELILSLASLVRELHQKGVFYRDLHAGNIMVRDKSYGPPELFLIDLHRASFFRHIFSWMKIKDLAQLCNSLPSTESHRLMFMREYCKAEGFSKESFTGFARKIYKKR